MQLRNSSIYNVFQKDAVSFTQIHMNSHSQESNQQPRNMQVDK